MAGPDVRPELPEAARSRWRWVPLASAIVVTTLGIATGGYGILLSPISLALTVVAFRRIEGRPEEQMWWGAGWNSLLFVLLTTAIAQGAWNRWIGDG